MDTPTSGLFLFLKRLNKQTISKVPTIAVGRVIATTAPADKSSDVVCFTSFEVIADNGKPQMGKSSGTTVVCVLCVVCMCMCVCVYVRVYVCAFVCWSWVCMCMCVISQYYYLLINNQ